MMSYEKRYQVFVSSTYFDLQEERHAVIMALLQLNAIPAGMELFPAADEDAWSIIKGVIDDCDYYLLVIGGRYGSVDPIEDISYTEKEYDYAIGQGKPVMAFLHGDPDAIPVGKAERSAQAQDKLVAFRKKVEASKHVKYWAGRDELAGKVALSFGQFSKSYPTVGWVRADQNASPETLAEINELRKRLAKLQQALDDLSTSPPAGAETLAQGDERFETWLNFKLLCESTNPAFRKIVSDAIEVHPSWDEIFSGLGPLMLDESSEESLAAQIDEWAGERFWADVKTHAIDVARTQDPKVNRLRMSNYEASLSWADFHTVLVQLVALGLITQSERKRSVSDKGTYWALTPYGRTRLIQLRALRRGETRSHSNDSNR